MWKFVIGLFTELTSLVGGALGGAFSMVTGVVKNGIDAVMQYHQEGIAFARDVGLSAKESQAYTATLIKSAKELGFQYGVDAKQVLELQRNITAATGRQLMLNDAEKERMLQVNRLVGSATNNQFMGEMMNKMGAQFSAVEGAVSKAYATGAKSGLSAAQFSKKVADNLSMANRLSFRDGVNGLIRMTALSEKLGISMQAVESAAGKFMDLESSIETSARLQMLGGSSAVFGGNPLEMMYEANYDPEAFAKRMSDSLSSYATFDVSKGMATINGGNMMFVREMANAMGISVDEASAMAKKNAEIKYKEQAFGATIGKYGEENRDFILNKSYVDAKTGHLMMNDVNGNKVDISKGELTQGIIDEMTKFEGMSDSELMKQQAQSLVSINEKIDGFFTTLSAGVAEALQPYLDKVFKLIDEYGGQILDKAIPAIATGIKNIGDWFVKNEDTIKQVLDYIMKIFGVLGFIADHIWSILGIIGGFKLFKFGRKAFRAGKSILSSTKGATGAAKVSKGASGLAKGAKATKGLSSLGKVGKIGKIVGKGGGGAVSVLGIGMGLYDMYQGGKAVHTYEETKSDLDKKLASGAISKSEYDSLSREALVEKRTQVGAGAGAALGGTIGAIFGGTAGAGFGASIGSLVGEGIGSVYTTIEENSKAFWNGPVKDFAKQSFGDVGVGLVDGIGTAVGGATSAIGGYIEDSLTNFSDTLDGLGDGFSQIINGDFIGGIGTILKTLGEGAFKTFIAIHKMLGEIFKSIGDGFMEFIKGLWKSFTGWFENAKKGVQNFVEHPIDTVKGWFGVASNAAKAKTGKGFASGGIVGGNSYTGDRVLARVNSGEMVLNKLQQTTLFGILTSVPNFVSGLLTNKNDVKAKPVGGKEYVYTPNGSETSRVGGNTVTVKDFNINLSGTIKLDGGNFSKDIDSSALLNDMSFMNKIKDIIKDSINSDMYSGRYMNDTSTLRGHATPSSVLRR